MAASDLLGQKTQSAAGRSEMFEGFRVIEEIREKNRRAHSPTAQPRAKATKGPARRPRGAQEGEEPAS